jgi:aminoglycoside phosphotransferase (APT) family kinase protein
MVDPEFAAVLQKMGLVAPGTPLGMQPLTGGVASDIVLVETPERRFCVKRALARLKVAAVWEAPVSRNAAEAAWLRRAQGWVPGAAPAILGEDRASGTFAMDYLPAETHPVWKTQLLAGTVDPAFAGAVGRSLAVIHSRSAADPSVPAAFANDDTFEAIRIEPYLRATARAHADLAVPLERLARATLSTKRALVHGDVSPKNILCGPDGPVFLDAECALFGDPAFDVAFCLNHLLLKGAREEADRSGFAHAFDAFLAAYFPLVDWEDATGLESRTAALLPALFLARIDGKSPVEYLQTDREKERVRTFARPLVASPPPRLSPISDLWRTTA